MNVDVFCKKYAGGITPTPAQRQYLEAFLAGETLFWGAGRGAGKSTVRRALLLYLIEQEETDMVWFVDDWLLPRIQPKYSHDDDGAVAQPG